MLPDENDSPPLVAHVVQRLAVGGLENGLINLINHMPEERYRHAILCLTESTDFADRIQRKDVPVIALHKRAGQDLRVHGRLVKILRHLRPDIVHTRNLATLEFLLPAALAGIPGRIHGEHGRDIYDLDGTNFKYNTLRRMVRPFVHHYVAVSRDLGDWLVGTVNVPPERVSQIYNGVDAKKFSCHTGAPRAILPAGFCSSDSFVIGTVGRMEAVKDQITLVRAFVHLLNSNDQARKRARLMVIGDGSLRREALQLLQDARAEHLAWLPGERSDVPEIMKAMDLFVLPSLREGISNTILEAMATGLPVVATRVGGNPELVEDGRTGLLVPASDPGAMAEAFQRYFDAPANRIAHGAAGRRRVEAKFSMRAMVDGYLKVYDAVLNRKRQHAADLSKLSASVSE